MNASDLACVAKEIASLEARLKELHNLKRMSSMVLPGAGEPLQATTFSDGRVRFRYLMGLVDLISLLPTVKSIEPVLYSSPNRLTAWDMAQAQAERDTLPGDEVIAPENTCTWSVGHAVEWRDENFNGKDQTLAVLLRTTGGVEHLIGLHFPEGVPDKLKSSKEQRRVHGRKKVWLQNSKAHCGLTDFLPDSCRSQRIDWWTPDQNAWNISIVTPVSLMVQALKLATEGK